MPTPLPADILPCPFHENPEEGRALNHTSNGVENVYVTCECGCEGPPAETLEEAVQLWNVRFRQVAPLPPAVADLLAELAAYAPEGFVAPTALQGFAIRAKRLLAQAGAV